MPERWTFGMQAKSSATKLQPFPLALQAAKLSVSSLGAKETLRNVLLRTEGRCVPLL